MATSFDESGQNCEREWYGREEDSECVVSEEESKWVSAVSVDALLQSYKHRRL
jgi:hypothetical protein